MEKVLYIIHVLRPVNALLTALSVYIGYWFASGSYFGDPVVLAALSAALICGGGNIFNDYYDKDIDLINKPSRPFAAGKIGKPEMIASGIFMFATGFVLSTLIGLAAAAVAFLTVIFLMIYNIYAKRSILIGNVIISILSGLAFIYGAIAANNPFGAVVPAVFALLYHFGREILKDIEDMPGDRSANIVTFPLRFGLKPALLTAVVTYCILISLTLLPYVLLNYSFLYLVTVVVCVDFLIVISFTRYLISIDRVKLKQLNLLLKAGMFFGLIALLLK